MTSAFVSSQHSWVFKTTKVDFPLPHGKKLGNEPLLDLNYTIILLNRLYNIFDIVVKTVDDHQTCVFPFLYKNKLYSDCTSDDGSAPWCSLTANYDVDREYGKCGIIIKTLGCPSM